MMDNYKSFWLEFYDLFTSVYEKKPIDYIHEKYAVNSDWIFKCFASLQNQEGHEGVDLNSISNVFSTWLNHRITIAQMSSNSLDGAEDFISNINDSFFGDLKTILYLIGNIEFHNNGLLKDKRIEQINLENVDNPKKICSLIDRIIIALESQLMQVEANYSQTISSTSLLEKENKEQLTRKLENDMNDYAENEKERINKFAIKAIERLDINFTTKQNKLNKSIKEQREDLTKRINLQAEDLNKKSVETSMTILGVFVGVVMVFFGGFTILENVVSGMGNLSVYRLYFTMLMFGLILFNVVVLLFYLISRITKTTIACMCPKNEDASENKCVNCKKAKRLKFICRFKNTMPYVYWGNVLIVSGLLFVFLLKEFSPKNALAPDLFTQTLPALGLTILIVVIYLVVQHALLTSEFDSLKNFKNNIFTHLKK